MFQYRIGGSGNTLTVVHRCIVDPAKGEGDKVIAREEHVTALHQVCVVSVYRGCTCMHVCLGRVHNMHARADPVFNLHTRILQSYGTDRKDVIILRNDSAPTVNSALPSTGVQFVRVHMTKRLFNSYHLNQLEAWGNVIPGASFVSIDGKDKKVSFKDG